MFSFEKLSTDDKISLMFITINSTMNTLSQQVYQCLLLSQKVHDLEGQISECETRLLLLEYKSTDMEARSRRINLIYGGLPGNYNENCHDTNFLKEHLKIDNCSPMPRAHRLGRYK